MQASGPRFFAIICLPVLHQIRHRRIRIGSINGGFAIAFSLSSNTSGKCLSRAESSLENSFDARITRSGQIRVLLEAARCRIMGSRLLCGSLGKSDLSRRGLGIARRWHLAGDGDRISKLEDDCQGASKPALGNANTLD